ncbi:hypothetical protein [Kitasatospora sp. NPDC091207]|uniref:hypothetical protein n=1 Tax=Kitasatospora sp. NPDC091207 TaxID=3364083 RepID=UPI0038098AD0
MKLFHRKAGKSRKALPVLMTAICTVAVTLGVQHVLPQKHGGEPRATERIVTPAAGGTSTAGFHLLDAAWTTADIVEKARAGPAVGRRPGL